MKIRKTRDIISEENLKYKSFIAYTIMAFLIIYPFIVRSYVGLLSEKQQEYFPNKMGYTADFFLYHKEIALLVFSVWLILFFIGEHIYPKHPFCDIPLRSKHAKMTLYLVGIYALCICVSSVFAADKKTAFLGSCTEYEGIAALLSYLVLFLAGYNYFRSPKFRNILKKGLIVLMTVIFILSLVEYFYRPIYEIDFLKYFIASKEQRPMAESLSNQAYVGKLTLSFYNPGYLGGLCSLLIPVSFGIAYEETARWRKILLYLLNVGLWFTLLGTGVTGPFLAAVIGMLILLCAMRKEGKALLKAAGTLIVSLVVVFFAINLFTEGAIVKRIIYVVTNNSAEEKTSERFELTDLEVSRHEIKISSGEKSICVRMNVSESITSESFAFFDGQGREIRTFLNMDGTIYLVQEGYETAAFAYKNDILYMELGYDDTIDFYATKDGFFLIGQNGAALSEVPRSRIKSEALKKLYPIATGRGYSWVNTLPILKECLLIGKGPGHFAYSFVQNEVVGLINTHGSCKLMVDKPHNWYLQIAVNTGMVSLVVVLTLFFRYFKGGLGVYMVRPGVRAGDTFEKALWSGLLAFCVSGIVNDSIVAVNPMFWMLLGVGCCAVDSKRDR